MCALNSFRSPVSFCDHTMGARSSRSGAKKDGDGDVAKGEKKKKHTKAVSGGVGAATVSINDSPSMAAGDAKMEDESRRDVNDGEVGREPWKESNESQDSTSSLYHESDADSDDTSSETTDVDGEGQSTSDQEVVQASLTFCAGE